MIGTAEVDTRVYSVSKRNVESQLAQLSINVQLISVCARVVYVLKTIRRGLLHIGSRCEKQRPDLLFAVKEELDCSAARTRYCSVAAGVAGVCRRALWKCLRHQVAPMSGEDFRQHR